MIVEVSGMRGKYEMTILDLNGQIIVHQRITNYLTSIDVSDFPCGMYFVRLKGDTGISVRKFVKTGF
jgi:hypothetical protein